MLVMVLVILMLLYLFAIGIIDDIVLEVGECVVVFGRNESDGLTVGTTLGEGVGTLVFDGNII